MSLSTKIREQLIASFCAELAEHVQTMTDGLLALEQGRVDGKERQSTLEDIFRAAHSLKGAARAIGVTMIEQLAHSLESVLDGLQHQVIKPTPELFTACYRVVDAIQEVQAVYTAGETTPPLQAIKALADLEPFRPAARNAASRAGASQSARTRASQERQAVKESEIQPVTPESLPQPRDRARRQTPSPRAAPQQQLSGARGGGGKQSVSPGLLTSEGKSSRPQEGAVGQESQDAVLQQAQSAVPDAATNGSSGSSPGGLGPNGNGTIRVSVDKLDALMNQLNELLATKIRAEQQLVQIQHLQEVIGQWQQEWLLVRSAFGRLDRQEKNGLLSGHRLKSVDALRRDVFGVAIKNAKGTGFSPEDWAVMVDGPNDNGSNGNVLRELGKDVSHLLSYVGANQAQLHEINALVNDMSRQYASDTTYMSMVIDELEGEIKRVRMLPLSTITGPFGRMVRDLAQQASKEAVLEIVGGDTELDKQVLEKIKDPLVHLLRNAVDHGVESPAQRVRRGKPRAGTITLSAEQLGKDIVVRVSDDGEGLDYDAIRGSIARRGVLDVESLSDADLREAIFQAGVTTSRIITDISGRGVGLDVVRRNAEVLRGTVDVSTEPGRGTTFTLTLPLRLASSRGLLVRAGGEMFAIPLNNVLKIESYSPGEIASLEGHDTIRYNGQPLTLVPLSDVLELPPLKSPPAGEKQGVEANEVLVVIVAAAERRMAFAVDGLAGEGEMVIKALGKQLSRVGGIAGATVLGNREVVLVLNVGDLIKLAMRGQRRSVLDVLAEAAPSGADRGQRRILVVDDSITTRTLEKNILEAAGYAVQLATDGQEAWQLLMSEGVPDLVVSDVAMPRMNGFELTERIKGNGLDTEVPVILVTSLDSPEDKARGIDAGADAYIVKSGFDQDNLLETIEQLI